MAESASIERRAREDRRKQPTPIFSRYTFIGKRTGSRRKGGDKGTYVDRYDRGSVALVLAIIILNLLDALFTHICLQKGGTEVNILVDWLIQKGVREFFAVKVGLTGLALLFLIVHKNFPFVKKALLLIFSFYFLLLLYHILLQISLIS